MKRAAAFNQGGLYPTIGVVNLSTVGLGKDSAAKEIDLPRLVSALQKYLDEHFVPIWGYPAKLAIYPNVKSIPADQWQFLFINDADTAGALGYHDLTAKRQPVSKIFTKTTLADDGDISVTASHEVAEMLIDPGAQLWAQKDDKTLLAYETADPVEEDTFLIDGIKMSNFVYPSWFENWKHPKGAKYDHLGLLKKPFSMTKGGYIILMADGVVTQQFGSAAKATRFAREHREGHRSEFRKALNGQNAYVYV